MKTTKTKETKNRRISESTEMNTGEYIVGTVVGVAAFTLIVPAYFNFVKSIFRDEE